MDITLCVNRECPLKDRCLRFRAMPDNHQHYARFEPVKGECEFRIAIQAHHRLEPQDDEQIDMGLGSPSIVRQ